MSTIWTVGHSTREWDEFLALLREHGIACVADVRRFPGSRKHPQFGREAMPAALEAAGIAYAWIPELGGRRSVRPDSPNSAWRNAAFRGYADHMESDEYRRGRERLVALAEAQPTAMLCAEGPWWRCHRALVSDDLKAGGWTVLHIAGARAGAKEHPYTPAASLVDGKLDYGRKGDLLG